MGLARSASAWLALYAAWWLFVGASSWQTAVWGAGLATVATAAGLVAWRVGLRGLAPRRSWFAELFAIPREVVADLAVLASVLAHAIAAGDRRTQGRFVRRQTDAGGGDPSRDRRAWLTLTATYSPNAYVVDIDAETGVALVHDLRVRRASEAPL